VAALQEEARLAAEQFPFPTGEAVHTIYFGGGTPSLLTLSELTQLLNAVRGHFNVDPDAEITLEVNPDDISEERLKEYGVMQALTASVSAYRVFLKKSFAG